MKQNNKKSEFGINIALASHSSHLVLKEIRTETTSTTVERIFYKKSFLCQQNTSGGCFCIKIIVIIVFFGVLSL